MAQQIGTIEKLQGVAFARADDGSQRQLQVGDAVFQGETIVTSAGAVLEIAVPETPSIVLPGDSELLLTAELLNETRDTAEDASVVNDTIATIVDALEGDGDLLDAIEAPAAGGATQDEGSSFVRLGRIAFALPEFASLSAGVDGQQLALDEAAVDNDLQLLLADGTPVDPGTGQPDPETPVIPEPGPEPEPEPEPEPPINLAPVAEDDFYDVNIDGAVAGNVLDNDSDPEGEKLTVTGSTTPANGTVVVNPDGSFTYEPNDGFSGEDRFEYTVSDDSGNTSTAEVIITVAGEAITPPPPPAPANAAPIAGDDSFSTAFQTGVAGSLFANDSDPDGDAISVSASTAPANGTVTVNANGTFNYTPNAGFSGSDSFEYTITDGNGGTSTATVVITVADEVVTPPPPPANVGPFAGDDSASLTEDTPITINVLGNDSDSDGTLIPGSVSIVSGPSHGSITINPDGSVNYIPDQDYAGLDSFTYTVTDDDGAVSNIATVGLAINNVREIAQFTDNWVNGVAYTTYDAAGNVTTTGLTGDQGEPGSFSYEAGERIVFSVGDVIVGDFPAGNVPDTRILFIHDIAGLSLANTNNQYVENTAVFLQALDSDLTDGDLSDGLQTNAVINRQEAFENGINITAETRAAYEGYVDPSTGQQLNLMNSWKNQVSDALAHVGIEFTRQSEADPDGQFPFDNIFESEALEHVTDTIRDDAVGGDREPGAFDTRLSDVIEADGGVITYFSNQIDMADPGARSIGFTAEGLLANAIPQQANLRGMEVEIAEGTTAFITRADGSKVQAGTVVYDDVTRTGSIELDSSVVSNADVAAGVLQTLEFGYTIWDWTASITVQVQPLDLFKAHVIAAPGNVPEDSPYNQFAMTHSLVGDLKAEDGSTFQSAIFTTDQQLTFKFTPEVFGPFAEYADDFIVPVEYSTDGGASWQVMAQVGTYQLPDYQPILPIFALTWTAGVEEVLVRIPIFDDAKDEQPNSDGPGGQGIEIIDITAEGENFFTENLQPGIIDNDPSSDLPLVGIDFVTVTEGDGLAVLTLTLSKPAVGDVSIDWNAAGLGAIAGQDFEAVSGTAIIPEGQLSVQIEVPIIDDALVEDTEFAAVNLTGVSSNAVIDDPQGTIRILDNDGLSTTFSIADVSVIEGEEAVVTITRSGDLDVQQAVSIASMTLLAGTDTAAAEDFTALGTTLVAFAAGQTTATVRIPTSSDLLDEPNETFRVELTNATNGAVIDSAAGVATVTILDDDGAPSFSVADVSVSEGGLATITVTRAGDAQGSQSVDITTVLSAGDTAEAGDFVANNATLTFAQGVTSQTFTVQTTQDDVFEGPETLSVALSNATGGATISDGTGVVTIVDDGTGPGPNPDNDTPTVSISGPVTVDEDAGTATYTVTLSNPSTEQITVDYATTDGTALAGSDYADTSGTLVFAAGETSKQVTVSITDDSMDEVDETFSIGLSNLQGDATLGTATAGTTIVDNEGAPSFSVADVSVSEGGLATITVTRSGDAQATQSVDIATLLAMGDTAEAGDFVTNNATLTFAQGVTSQTFTVQTTQDEVFEGPETFSVELSNATGGATISDDTGVVTILDDGMGPGPNPDNDTPTVSISGPTSIDEDVGTATYTVTLSNPSTADISVDYATFDGSALAGSDYADTNGTLMFAAGEISKQVTVTIINDTLDEVDETFSIGLSNLVGEAVLGTATAGTTILDNDPTPNIGPETDGKTLTVAEDTSNNAVPTLTGSDSDGTVSGFVITILPTNGTLLLGGVAVTAGQTIPAGEAGDLTYTPNAGYFGDDSFSYASVDDDGAQDATPAAVSITVDQDTTPMADSLTALAGIASGSGPDGTLANPQLEVLFDVDGLVDGVELEDMPTLGGADNETSLEDLIFTLRSVPTDGILYLDVDGDGSFVPAQSGDTFNSGSSLYWAKSAEQVVQDLSTDASGVTVSGFNGASATITQSGAGLGVQSGDNIQAEAPTQLGYRNGSSESMVLDLGGPATEATVRIERLFPNEGEVGRVEALGADGSVLGSWTFFGRANATLGGVPIDFNIGGSGGSFTIDQVGQPFFALRFTATPYVDGVTQGSGNTDSSDYFVKSVAYTPIAQVNTEFTYDVTDQQGNVSDPATVTIRQSNTPIALDLNDDGVEYLSREAGVVFTDQMTGEAANTSWVASEDGLLVVDANQSGTVDEVREYVFTEWSENAKTDMEAVAEVFDTNKNDMLDAGDEAWSQFAVWQDKNSDGITDEGELISLDELGVESIALTYSDESVASIEADGDVVVHGQSDVTWTDGSVTIAEDASFAIDIGDVLSDSDAIQLPGGESDDTVITQGRDGGVGATSMQPVAAAADVAALEVDLMLNSNNDEKPESGNVD